jgi:serine/threonine-protein kinase
VAAIKVLAPELAADPGFVSRFQREIEVLDKLNHPNIVRLYGSGHQDGRYYFAMEYVDGPSFETLRQDRPRFPWREVIDLALQIAPALKHAHDRGIIHRDLKPGNLLRAPDGTVKLTDFGIASLFTSRHLTAAGTVLGTAEYLSPEQAAGRLVTPRSDLYSLGVVLYTLLTGRPPFEGELVELLQKHRYAQFDRPSRIVLDLPGDLDAMICELLAKEPAQRPADAGVLARNFASLRRRLDYKSSSDTGQDPPRTKVLSPSKAAPLPFSHRGRPDEDAAESAQTASGLLNHPIVLVLALAATLGILAWTFWPLGPDTLYQRGTALMASTNPDDWEKGWNDYLAILDRKYPDRLTTEERNEFRKRVDGVQSGRRARLLANRAGPMSEPQWFYQLGLRLRQQGDEPGARRVWQALANAFQGQPAEAPWVRLAEERLSETAGDASAERKLDPVADAVRQAKLLRAAGKNADAEALLQSLRELYGDDPAVKPLLDK